MIWRARVDAKKGLFHMYRDKPFAKDEIWFDVSIAEIDRMLKLYANSNWVFLSLVRTKGMEAIERWIENSPTDFMKRKRRELFDGDIYGEDQAISVIKKTYTKHTGKQPISIYEKLTAKDRTQQGGNRNES
jgi:hypothetical protein